jgi:type IV pilus assembly protein PilN
MTTTINLLPWREERRERNQRFFIIGLGASAGVAFIIALLTFFVLESKIEHQINRNRLIENEIARYEREIAEIKKLKSTRESLIARMKIIQRLEESRPEVVHFFDKLVTVIPRAIYLLKIERFGNEIMLTGHTDANSTVSQFMQNIRQNYWLNRPILEEVAEVTNKKRTELYNQFRLKVLLKPKSELEAEEELVQ